MKTVAICVLLLVIPNNRIPIPISGEYYEGSTQRDAVITILEHEGIVTLIQGREVYAEGTYKNGLLELNYRGNAGMVARFQVSNQWTLEGHHGYKWLKISGDGNFVWDANDKHGTYTVLKRK